jgi:hypothetical protein
MVGKLAILRRATGCFMIFLPEHLPHQFVSAGICIEDFSRSFVTSFAWALPARIKRLNARFTREEMDKNPQSADS